MNKNSIVLGLTLAIALTTGTVLVKHPPAYGNKAQGAPTATLRLSKTTANGGTASWSG